MHNGRSAMIIGIILGGVALVAIVAGGLFAGGVFVLPGLAARRE